MQIVDSGSVRKRVRPPARLVAYFADEAAVGVIVRRGPSRYSQMILWDTGTDEFTPGQWTRGNVQYFELSRNGKYASIQLMGIRPRRDGGLAGEQVSIISRPPYFTALGYVVGALCTTSPLPIASIHQRVNRKDKIESVLPSGYSIRDGSEGMDQRGRRILLEQGKVWLLRESDRKLLFDANPYWFEAIPAPHWALNYD